MRRQFEQLQSDTIMQRRIPLSADQRLIILQKLQGQLEIDSLFKTFVKAIKKHIDISRLIWEHEGISHIVRQEGSSEFRQTFTLKFAQSTLGMLQYHTPYELDADEIGLLHSFHRLLAGPLHNAIEYNRVRSLSMQDTLTGLQNRNCFDHDLSNAIATENRVNNGLILMLFDLNDFKQINDKYGHLEGDKVLQQFGIELKKSIRNADNCYRLGGDEFTVLLSPANKKAARLVFSRLTANIENNLLLKKHNISCALGCAFFRQGDNYTTLFERADRNMYQFKRDAKSSSQ